MKSRILVSLVILSFIVTACAGKKATLLETIKQKGVIVVGTSADYAPFESKDSNGNFVGYDMDMVREIGKLMGVKVDIQDMGFDSIIASIQTGKIDIGVAGISDTPAREKIVDFTIPYYQNLDSVLVTGDSKVSSTTPQDIAKYKVGLQTGTGYDSWVEDNLVKKGLMSENNVFRYDNAQQGVLDLKAGRIDLFIINNAPGQIAAKAEGLTIAWSGSITPMIDAIAVPKGQTDLLNELNSIIQQLKDNGYLDTLKAQYIK